MSDEKRGFHDTNIKTKEERGIAGYQAQTDNDDNGVKTIIFILILFALFVISLIVLALKRYIPRRN